MLESAAKTWLAKHNKTIPALDILHHRALETLNDKTATISDLAVIITLDPGMSISLYHQVNSELKHAGQSSPTTVDDALGFLGNSAIVDLITQHKTLSEMHPDIEVHQAYHQLMSRDYHMLSQLEHMIAIRGVRSIREIRSAAVLHNIGEICACLFDFEKYRHYQQKFHLVSSAANSAKPVFGFDFNELGRIAAEKMNLPELVRESLQVNAKSSPESHLIQLAADISHQAEEGWNHSAMTASLEVCATYLNQQYHEFAKQARLTSIQAARNFPIDDVFPAAAGLILLPDIEKPASKSTKTKTAQPALTLLKTEIRVLIKSPKASQAQIMELLVNDLHDELHFSKVVILLFSENRSSLFTYLSKGLVHDSPFHSLQIEIVHSGLFKSLLNKPHAIWVNSGNYKKFSRLLPSSFKQACYSENFFLMSLFVGIKPVGLVFCDHSKVLNKLNDQIFTEFKFCVSFVSKALNFVAQRDRCEVD
jgi:HD-like signal output (HDOD) protein